jgi:hypothetical protein
MDVITCQLMGGFPVFRGEWVRPHCRANSLTTANNRSTSPSVL